MQDENSAPVASPHGASLSDQIAQAKAAMDALLQQQAAEAAKSQQQSVYNAGDAFNDGEWEYTVKVGDKLRFPSSVRKLNG